VAADVERNLAVAAIVGELAESIATCVTDEGGKGVRGTSTSIEVAFAGVPAWRIGTDEPAAALAPVDTLTLRFDAGDGRVEIGRDGAAATRGPVAAGGRAVDLVGAVRSDPGRASRVRRRRE
jgi:hypothetical protein